VYISNSRLEELLREDAPYLDLTTVVAGLEYRRGKMTMTSAKEMTVACVEEAARMCRILGLDAKSRYKSGERCKGGDVLIEAAGDSSSLHIAWKPVQNLLENCCAIATYTAEMVKQLSCVVNAPALLTTRKHFPGTKEFALKSIAAGGALPHRSGISDSLLVFQNHFAFFPEDVTIGVVFASMKKRLCEKKLIVESETIDEAFVYASSGADGIQFDRMSPVELSEAVRMLREEFPSIVLLGAGEITIDNAASYATTGVDALVTSAPYYAKPVDIRVSMLME